MIRLRCTHTLARSDGGAGRGGVGEERERQTEIEIGRNVRHTLFIAGHQRRRGEEAAYGKALALACPDRVL